MKRFGHYWIATLARGLVAIAFGCGVILVPDLAATFLLAPLAIAIAVLFLATYGVLDSAITTLMSFMVPKGLGRTALRLQGLIGITLGLALYFAVYDHVRVRWYIYLIVAQALSLASTDFFVARHLSRKHGSRAAYITSSIAATAGVAYLGVALRLGDTLSVAAACWMIFPYLLAFGFAQSTLAAEMLFREVTECHDLHHAVVPTAGRA